MTIGLHPDHFSRKASGRPVLITPSGTSVALTRLDTGPLSCSEARLQQLVFDHPEVLPISDIEPGFGAIYPVAMEVPCSHGVIDNLYVTASGDIVLVEAKLWRNPQARREVVAQALDYVAALTGMDFEAFESACRKGQGMAAPKLHTLVADQPDALAEPDFVDAVSRNLARGRMLVIALGDGIRAEAEVLAGLLQSHAGAHFTFALVELALWRNPQSGDLIALPSTLAQTVMITRGIVRIEEGKVTVAPAPATASAHVGSISEEMFFEQLAKTDPALPKNLRDFVATLEPLGIYPEQKASVNLKADLAEADRPLNFGYVTKTGKLWTDALALSVPADVAQSYNETLAALIGGTVARFPSGVSYVSTNGKSAPHISALLPRHAAAWTAAITQVFMQMRSGGKQLSFEDLYRAGVPLLGLAYGEPRSPVMGFVRLADGIAWCDDGIRSQMCSGNPLHFIDGPVEEADGALHCGNTILRPIAPDEHKALAYWNEAVADFGSVSAMHAKAEALLLSLFGGKP